MIKNSLKYQGFSLIELMITIAIIAILATIAMPAYNHYIERGYLSQAHTELMTINNQFKATLIKNPSWSNSTIRENLDTHIAGFQGDPAISNKYQYSHPENPDTSTRNYHLIAIPRDNTGYTLALWMDSVGNAYKCTNKDSAKNLKKVKVNGVGCEKI